jgi:hypothetical protein
MAAGIAAHAFQRLAGLGSGGCDIVLDGSIVAVGVHTIGSAAADHRDALSSSSSAEALLQLVPILSAALLPGDVAPVLP